MAVYHDQLNRRIDLPVIPKRIISVVPSQTELLFYLGLDEEVIGITKFCIHPAAKFKSKIKIGGTKQLNIEQIRDLKPDLIIANKEENEQSQIEALMHICPVWISDISNLEEAYDMINRVGVLVGKEPAAAGLAGDLKSRFSQLNIPPLNLRVAYFIWRKPYMAAGRETFINDLLQKCGLINVFQEERYPEISEAKIKVAQPDVVLLSSEPYPFTQRHIDEFKHLLPKSKILLVDGELFSWYGSRLLHAPAYFKQLIENITAKQ
jgi:ABC-type Fe3+-hydroxamate transport system substrate-binding protein